VILSKVSNSLNFFAYLKPNFGKVVSKAIVTFQQYVILEKSLNNWRHNPTIKRKNLQRSSIKGSWTQMEIYASFYGVKNSAVFIK
jgi:hypothetical protein